MRFKSSRINLMYKEQQKKTTTTKTLSCERFEILRDSASIFKILMSKDLQVFSYPQSLGSGLSQSKSLIHWQMGN